MSAPISGRDTFACSPAVAHAPLGSPAGDYILVPRSILRQLFLHLLSEHERFPARRLRQALQILEHLLQCRGQIAA